MTAFIIPLLCLASVIRVSHQDSLQELLVSDQCLDCLCELQSKCNVKRGCKDGDCGPFHITMSFWEDAVGIEDPDGSKRQDENLKNEYQLCTTDLLCSTTAIQNYMKRYQRDCDKDGDIDCLDIAAIHNLGPTGCLTKPLPKEKRAFMETCLGRNKPGVYSTRIHKLTELGKEGNKMEDKSGKDSYSK